jgi:hypothetical protein
MWRRLRSCVREPSLDTLKLLLGGEYLYLSHVLSGRVGSIALSHNFKKWMQSRFHQAQIDGLRKCLNVESIAVYGCGMHICAVALGIFDYSKNARRSFHRGRLRF